MLSLPTQTTYNHMKYQNRLDENSSTYKKWIKRRVQRKKNFEKNYIHHLLHLINHLIITVSHISHLHHMNHMMLL